MSRYQGTLNLNPEEYRLYSVEGNDGRLCLTIHHTAVVCGREGVQQNTLYLMPQNYPLVHSEALLHSQLHHTTLERAVLLVCMWCWSS